MNVLITAATSAKAHQLKNNLKDNVIFMGDHLDLPAFMLSSGQMIGLPDPGSSSYSHKMLSLCLDNNIEKIYLLREEEYSVLFQAEQLFNEYGISLVNEV